MKILERRRIASAPRRSLAELPEGVVARVVGRAGQLTDVLEAPLSGRPCLYFQLTISRPILLVSTTLAYQARAVVFTIDDGTERAVVDPDGCTADLTIDERDASGAAHAPTGRESALLARFGIDANEVMGDVVFREAIIGIGEEIAVVASGVREPDPEALPDATYRGAPRTRLRLSGMREHPILISDHPSTTR